MNLIFCNKFKYYTKTPYSILIQWLITLTVEIVFAIDTFKEAPILNAYPNPQIIRHPRQVALHQCCMGGWRQCHDGSLFSMTFCWRKRWMPTINLYHDIISSIKVLPSLQLHVLARECQVQVHVHVRVHAHIHSCSCSLYRHVQGAWLFWSNIFMQISHHIFF